MEANPNLHAPSNIPVTTMNAILDKKAPLGHYFAWPAAVWVAFGPGGLLGVNGGGEYFVLAALTSAEETAAIDAIDARLAKSTNVLRISEVPLNLLVNTIKEDAADRNPIKIAGLIVVDGEGREIDRRYAQP